MILKQWEIDNVRKASTVRIGDTNGKECRHFLTCVEGDTTHCLMRAVIETCTGAEVFDIEGYPGVTAVRLGDTVIIDRTLWPAQTDSIEGQLSDEWLRKIGSYAEYELPNRAIKKALEYYKDAGAFLSDALQEIVTVFLTPECTCGILLGRAQLCETKEGVKYLAKGWIYNGDKITYRITED